jgi:predicted acetyltransferase
VSVEIVSVGEGDREQLRALVELYVYDFSELLGFDVADDGRFATPLDRWLADARTDAFFTRVDGKLGGFAIVVHVSRLTGDERVHDMAEFFVLRKYRRRGVGAHVATALFDRFGGPWEVRQRGENAAATAFWRRVIGDYTGGRFDDLVLDDDRWRGPVQRFEAARR